MTRLSDLESIVLQAIADPAPLAHDEAFNHLALTLFRYQFAQNEPYRKFCEKTLQGREPKSWREIPAVPTSAFRYAPLRAFPESDVQTTFRTSGTTGEGYGEHHFASTQVYEASILAAWDRLQLPALRQVLLVQSPDRAPHSSLSHMMGVLGRLAPQTYVLTESGQLDLDRLQQAVQGEPPLLLLGTALAFLHLFESLGEANLSLPAGSLALETGGYKGSGRSLTKEALYALFEEKLGLLPDAILNEYSMTELSSQWYTRGLGKPHVGPSWTRALILSPETGEEVPLGEGGVIRLFDLANVGSVIAIQTQDLAIRTEEGFILLGRDPAALPRGCSRAADELLRGGSQ